MTKHYYWDVTMHGEGGTPEEAWDLAVEEFMNAKIPAPKPSRISEPDQDEPDDTTYRNYYVHCKIEWDNEWSCMCNDECPVCKAEIEPYYSEELGDDGKVVDTIWHVDEATFVPEQGWPADH